MDRDKFDAAGLKLKQAAAISDLIGILSGHKGGGELKDDTLCTASLHVVDLIEDARNLLAEAHQ